MSPERPERIDPPLVSGEAETVLGFLEWHRATLVGKCQGLDAAALEVAVPPSTMTLGGMLTHLAFVEDYWTGHVLAGRGPTPPWDAADWEADPDADWHLAAAPAERFALLERSVQTSRRVVEDLLASPAGLDSVGAGSRGGERVSLRWVLVHLVEEYARHNGHADLIREAVDGSVGE